MYYVLCRLHHSNASAKCQVALQTRDRKCIQNVASRQLLYLVLRLHLRLQSITPHVKFAQVVSSSIGDTGHLSSRYIKVFCTFYKAKGLYKDMLSFLLNVQVSLYFSTLVAPEYLHAPMQCIILWRTFLPAACNAVQCSAASYVNGL